MDHLHHRRGNAAVDTIDHPALDTIQANFMYEDASAATDPPGTCGYWNLYFGSRDDLMDEAMVHIDGPFTEIARNYLALARSYINLAIIETYEARMKAL